MLGTTVRERFPNGEYDDYAQLLDSVLARGESGEIEKIVAPPYSDLHLVHSIRMVAEHDENGEVIGVLAIGRDITERKLSEDALRESEEKYRTLVEKIQAAVIVHSADTQILTSNPVAQEILGLTEEQLYGKTAIDPDWHFFREDGSSVLPDDYPVNQVLASGKALKNHVLGVHRPDRQEDVWALVNADPVFGKDGAITQVIVTFIDITQRKRAERELVLLNRAMNTSSDAAFLMTEQGRFVYVNDTACRSLSYSREELIDMSPLDIDPDITPEIFQEFLEEIFSTDSQRGTIESRHRSRDGRIFPVELAASVIEVDGAKFCLSMARDITERKQAERRLWLMDFALNQVREAVYIIDLSNLNFISINDEACRSLGYNRGELLRMTVFDIDPDAGREEMQQLQNDIDAADLTVFERRHKAKDGRIFPVEINAMVFEYEGKPACIALARDITERKRAEDEILALNADLERRVLERTEELRQQTRYLRTLIDTLPMMAWLKDKDSRFLVVNQATALACSHNVEDLIGKSSQDFWPNGHAESHHAGDVEVMTTRQRKTVEESFVDAASGDIWVETFRAPVVDEDGSVLGTVGISRDISDRKAMEKAREEALAEAERLAHLRSEFMARMSHELRTPLNGILGYAQLLQGETQDNERQSAMLNVIHQSGEYLLTLINDILDFAKIEAGRQELNLSDIHLPRFLRDLAGIITIKAEQKKLAFVCDIAPDIPSGIRADEMRLRQVLLNLLSNAVKYTDRGRICLRVTLLESGRLRFEVQDSGTGIDSEHLESIFRPFEQAGYNRIHTGGTGLGLPISRELVRLMGGDIQVRSKTGEGSCFWFDLAVPVVEVSDDISLPEQHAVGYQGLRRRVQVVDDVSDNRMLLIDILSRLGFETFEAGNGQQCLDRLETQRPDLILLDMIMPEMDGLETARRLRRFPGFEQTPIIAVSASASNADIAEAMKAGVNAFLAKPIDIKRLLAQIALLLKLDWVYRPEDAGTQPRSLTETLVAPPEQEMAILHRLAQEGSMRDIVRQAAYLEQLDERYRPFAKQLRALAQGYQSKAVLDLVERYLINHSSNTDGHGSTGL